MKRIASLLLLLIITTTFIYNVIGLHLLSSLKKEQAWVTTMEKIPHSYFKVIKLNASVYSFVEDVELEYVNENVVINSRVFHIFKKEIKDNIIKLYYLPNKQQNATNLALKKLVDSDLFENSTLNKKPLEKVFKSFLKDYVPSSFPNFEITTKENHTALSNDSHPNGTSNSGYLEQAYSPPKLA